MQSTLTADERSFAESAQGRSHLASARHNHAMQQRTRGDHAKPWTAAIEADVIRKGAQCQRWGE